MDIKIRFFSKGCTLFLPLVFCLFFDVPAQDSLITADTNRLTVLFSGDIMGHDGQIRGAYDSLTGIYDYEPTFRYIKDYLSSADITIGNLEVTLAGPPYKGYPQFSSPDELAVETKNAGFDILAMANNHALDGGKKGFLRTLNVLDSLEMLHLGTYRDSTERDKYHPLIFEKKGIRIALLNYTYGTNGLKISLPCLINRIDTAQIRLDLQRALLANVDITLVFIHWGIEYERFENREQQKLADFMLQNGTDAIIGSHPHVVQPIKYYHDKKDTLKVYPVVYSLGNFVSNQREQYKDGGIVAELHLSKTCDGVVIDSLNYLPYWVWREDKAFGRNTFYVLPVSKYELDPQAFNLNENDIYRLNRFATDTREHLGEVGESDFYLKKKEPY
jgi:hypothetical protein